MIPSQPSGAAARFVHASKSRLPAAAGTGGQGEEGAVACKEHVANVRRARRVFGIGALLFLLSPIEILGGKSLGQQSSAAVWAVRAALLVVLVLAWARLRREPLLGPRWLRFLDIVVFGLGSITIALSGVEHGGLQNLHTRLLLVVLIGQAFTVPASHLRNAARFGVTIGFYLGTLVLGTALSPTGRSQLHNPAALAMLADQMGAVLMGAALLVVGSHELWSARRRNIETRTVGRYILKEQIGLGGMGAVWRAQHPALKHEVAVKIMRPEAATPELITRFEREIRALTDLSHPNTVRVLDCGTSEEGVLYFVMELVHGDSLRKLVQREGPLQPERAVHIVRQVACALAEAHALGIVHRDIKPDNILVTQIPGERDFVKVLDFGIAKHEQDAAGASEVTRAGMLIGSPAYLSPEQAAAEEVDARSDLYSLGAVLFFALTGRPPFEGSMTDLLYAHMTYTAPWPSAFAPNPIHPALDALVRICLSKDPDDRYASALDLDTALGEITPFHQSERPPPPALKVEIPVYPESPTEVRRWKNLPMVDSIDLETFRLTESGIVAKDPLQTADDLPITIRSARKRSA